MKIIKAQPIDLTAVHELHNEVLACKYSYDSLAKELTFPYSDFYVLKNNEQIVAYFIIHYLFETMDLVTLAVRPDYQGLGYGSFLMDYIVYLAKKNNCTHIMLEVSEHNGKALSFYKKHHFNLINKRLDYYAKAVHALILRKELTDEK